MISGISLVTGLEIEYLSVSSCPGTTASEDLAALEPTEEYCLLGLGNVKSLAVHLFGIEHEGLVNTGSDRMIGLDAPDPFSFAVSPLQRAGSAHELLEYFGIVSGMEYDNSHTRKHVLMNSVYIGAYLPYLLIVALFTGFATGAAGAGVLRRLKTVNT